MELYRIGKDRFREPAKKQLCERRSYVGNEIVHPVRRTKMRTG